MKKYSLFSVLSTMTLLVSAILFFSSCQQEDTVGALAASISERTSAPDVPAILEVPAGHEVSFHAYAEGVQIYRSSETAPGVYSWVFQGPEATLYANAAHTGVVGTHYGGPTWESNSGSKVVAVKVQGATVDAAAIPWLLLVSSSTTGPGIFEGTTYIQRVNTVGGLAPAEGANGGNVGEELRVPYTAEYYFYTAE